MKRNRGESAANDEKILCFGAVNDEKRLDKSAAGFEKRSKSKARRAVITMLKCVLAVVIICAAVTAFINIRVVTYGKSRLAGAFTETIETGAGSVISASTDAGAAVAETLETASGEDLETSIEEAREFGADCILILGAGIIDSETPSKMLRDRLDAGIALYQAGAAPKILLSGDNGTYEHNEIHVMLNYCLRAGVPPEDIFCDHAGFSTYESMVRASEIFNVEKAVIVTQSFHEYRALFIANHLDVEAIGFSADQKRYSTFIYDNLREMAARVKDYFKLCLKMNDAVGGEVIDIHGDGTVSHGDGL
ncbi:MAG: SanA/YdcF family protein [Eubacterium sp.]|jgi:SanA protein